MLCKLCDANEMTNQKVIAIGGHEILKFHLCIVRLGIQVRSMLN